MSLASTIDDALYIFRDTVTNADKILGLSFNKSSPQQTGQFVSRVDAKEAPQLSFRGNADATYLVICVDLDPPFPSLSFLGPSLHWIQSGFKLQASSDDAESTLFSSDIPFVADYRPPRPPPLSGPHRYVFLLYEQPSTFNAKKYAPANGALLPLTSRLRYDLKGFEKEAKLGPFVAANYFFSG